MAPALKALFVAALGAPLLTGCVIYDSTDGDDVSVRVGNHGATAEGAVLETLGGLRFEPGVVIALVGSNGCTDASDFEVGVAEGETTDLTFTRSSPDLCKALVPGGVELRWTYADLGLEPGDAVAVRNPVRLP